MKTITTATRLSLRHRLSRAAAVFLMAVCASALATDGRCAPHLAGAGAETCADFLKKSAPDGLSDGPALQWVMGYLTGRALGTPEGMHQPFRGPEGIAADVTAYCRLHPQMQIDQAAASFFEPPQVQDRQR